MNDFGKGGELCVYLNGALKEFWKRMNSTSINS